MDKKELVIDLSGLKCPLPVLKTRKRISTINIGEVLSVICTDPLSLLDVPNFVSENGHILIEQSEVDGKYLFTIQRGK